MSAKETYHFTDELGPHLTEEKARAIYSQGPEAVVFALLTQAKRQGELLEQDVSASTPSGMIPVYQKENTKRNKKSGRPHGHPGVRRKTPAQIDHREEHCLEHCPHCKSKLEKPTEFRTRITEDIPEPVKPKVIEHTIHRYWCKTCKKMVEKAVTDALPGCTVGHNIMALTAWLHYSIGNTLSQILSVLNYYLQFPLSEGGLVQIWQRMTVILLPWYEQIGEEARKIASLHADETGWRVAGKTHWLWCFTNQEVTYYMITRNRGAPALQKFFADIFEGILITDFWGAYNKIACDDRQMCLVHLFRELTKVDALNSSVEWEKFRKRLKRLMRDAIRLSRKDDLAEEGWISRRSRLDERLDQLINTPWKDKDAKRLVKRLKRHREHLFTFIDHKDIPFDNNHAEREIRPAVIIRKNSLANGSIKGAESQACLMSIYRTLKLRGKDPIKTIVDAIKTYINTGVLPPLPEGISSDG